MIPLHWCCCSLSEILTTDRSGLVNESAWRCAAFKVKTNAASMYRVSPSHGVVQPGEGAVVRVALVRPVPETGGRLPKHVFQVHSRQLVAGRLAVLEAHVSAGTERRGLVGPDAQTDPGQLVLAHPPTADVDATKKGDGSVHAAILAAARAARQHGAGRLTRARRRGIVLAP